MKLYTRNPTQASTTELGKLFQIFTRRAEKNAFVSLSDLTLFFCCYFFPRKVEVIKCTVKVRWENFETYLSRISCIAFSRFVGTSFSLPAFSHPALSISSTQETNRRHTEVKI